MHQVIQFAETAYIEAQNLMPLLANYTNPRDFISRMVKRGELIRLKNGFFIIADKIKTSSIPFAQIANLLYGPSYISFEWALAYYGMIPEGVYVVTSASFVKSKSYQTPIGTFDYIGLSRARYSIGIDQQENSQGKFLLATPEKAIVDLVHFKSQKLNIKDLLIDLIESRRIDKHHLKNLNKEHLIEIASRYRSLTVNKLVNVLGLL